MSNNKKYSYNHHQTKYNTKDRQANDGLYIIVVCFYYSDTNTRMNLTIPKELKKQLEEIAKLQNRSLNNLIITILKEKFNLD